MQSQHDAGFAGRMYAYNHRLQEAHGRMPVSLAVLGDESRGWRPGAHRDGRWGCEVKFTFPVAKLADWRDREHVLEQSPNPFAAFGLAHLKAVETDRKPDERLTWKSRIVKRLYDRGMSHTDLLQLFRLIDWMMTLPPVLTNLFVRDLQEFEEERAMPIITPTEQMWLEQGEARGRAEGRHDGIELGLKLRFGPAGVALMPRVREVKDPAALGSLLTAVETATDLAAFAALLPPPAGG